ncbi:hypothetical protein Tco_0007505 [Tanacetum coccineum]
MRVAAEENEEKDEEDKEKEPPPPFFTDPYWEFAIWMQHHSKILATESGRLEWSTTFEVIDAENTIRMVSILLTDLHLIWYALMGFREYPTTNFAAPVKKRLPYFTNVQIEPIVVQIDQLDLLEENENNGTYYYRMDDLVYTFLDKGSTKALDKVAELYGILVTMLL